LDDKKTTLQQYIRTLGGLMTGNATVKIVSADFEVIAKLEKEMTRARQELELWDGSCKSQADMFVASQTQRAGLIERLNKLESWIHESLTTAKSVVGASVMNSAHGDTTSIPDRFKPVITDGATAFLYQYRGEMQQYQINFERFEDGIKNIQSLLINKFDYIRSTVINRPTSSNSGVSF
jgi:hypothetical protein